MVSKSGMRIVVCWVEGIKSRPVGVGVRRRELEVESKIRVLRLSCARKKQQPEESVRQGKVKQGANRRSNSRESGGWTAKNRPGTVRGRAWGRGHGPHRQEGGGEGEK